MWSTLADDLCLLGIPHSWGWFQAQIPIIGSGSEIFWHSQSEGDVPTDTPCVAYMQPLTSKVIITDLSFHLLWLSAIHLSKKWPGHKNMLLLGSHRPNWVTTNAPQLTLQPPARGQQPDTAVALDAKESGGNSKPGQCVELPMMALVLLHYQKSTKALVSRPVSFTIGINQMDHSTN